MRIKEPETCLTLQEHYDDDDDDDKIKKEECINFVLTFVPCTLFCQILALLPTTKDSVGTKELHGGQYSLSHNANTINLIRTINLLYFYLHCSETWFI